MTKRIKINDLVKTPMGNGIVIYKTKTKFDIKHTEGVFIGAIREYKRSKITKIK